MLFKSKKIMGSEYLVSLDNNFNIHYFNISNKQSGHVATNNMHVSYQVVVRNRRVALFGLEAKC